MLMLYAMTMMLPLWGSPLLSCLFPHHINTPWVKSWPDEVNGKTPIDFTGARIICSKELYGFSCDYFLVFTFHCIPYLLFLFADECSLSHSHLFSSCTPNSWNESTSKKKLYSVLPVHWLTPPAVRSCFNFVWLTASYCSGILSFFYIWSWYRIY